MNGKKTTQNIKYLNVNGFEKSTILIDSKKE